MNGDCSACGKDDYKGATSNKCPNKILRPGKEKLKISDPFRFVKRNHIVYKQGLRSFCTDSNLRTTHLQVKNATINSFHATRLLNFDLQRLLELQLRIPDVLNASWFRQFFTCRLKDNDIKDTMEQFPNFAYKPVDGQIISYLVKEYIVNFELHLQNQ